MRQYIECEERGQGLNPSISDAGKLITSLTSLSLSQPDAVALYEKEMEERTGEGVRLSVLNTQMLHDYSKVLESPVMKAVSSKNK